VPSRASRRRPLAAILTLSVIVAACTPASVPAGSPAPTEEARQPAQASGFVAPRHLRSVSVVGSTIAASGNFRGTGKSTQIALLQDALKNMSLRIAVREMSPDTNTFSESEWLKTPPDFFALGRAKVVVADVDADGKDDLVALYADGETRSRLLVLRSTGSSFLPPETWWTSDDYAWNRARNILSGDLTGTGRDSLAVIYQYDGFQMRVHLFEPKGSAFAFGGAQGIYDTGVGQFDASRARFAVGHFTRSNGADQIASFYQYPNARVRLSVFDPTPSGMTLMSNVFETADGDYDLGRASIAAADVTGDGADDLVSLYGASDGAAVVHVFDAARAFQPSNSWAGWASLPTGSVCAGAPAMLVGDWNGDGKADANSIVPGDVTEVRSNVLRNAGTRFEVTSTREEMLCPRWPLTGLPLGGGVPTRRPLYVKIDNNPTARPHYGISQADQVYEWLVEGLTTRLAAVFQSRQPDVIGSVRSARMTDRPILPSLGAVMVYSGGGPEELMGLHYDDAVAQRYVDLSPGYGWGYRVPFRPAPYNYFTTYQALRDAVAAAPRGDEPVTVHAWDFLPASSKDPLAGGFADSVAASSLSVPYRAGFAVRYEYDPASRAYARFDNGVREVDAANGEVVAARNVVVILTEVHFTEEWGLDPAGSPKLDMQLTGTGRGLVFRDGRREEVTWSRPDIFDVFLLRNANGELVRLSSGQTWIHIVPKDWSIPSQ